MALVELKGVEKRYADGTRAVSDINLAIADGEFLCVLGPSGCGKSTTLRMIAGLEEVSAGQIVVDGRDVARVPSRERDIAMVFENYALYPHLDVFHNIAMPLVARALPRAEISARVAAIAETLDIARLLPMRPKALSGGQRQRVSLARAMVRQPKMFLMDEPLGHLEAYMRIELRREIRRLHEATGGTTFYITHDQEEAAAISDRIAVMSAGQLQQVGPIADLLERPRTRFVAEFVGEPPINIFEDVRVDSTSLTLAGKVLELTEPARARLAPAMNAGPVALGLRPGDIALAAPDWPGLPVRILAVQLMGDWATVFCDAAGQRLRLVTGTDALPTEGETRIIVPQFDKAHAFDASGRNILLRGH